MRAGKGNLTSDVPCKKLMFCEIDVVILPRRQLAMKN